MVSTKKEANLKKQAIIRQEIENLIGIFQQAGSNAAFLEIQSRQKELQKLENQPMYQSDMPNITNYDVYINSPSNPIPVRGRPKKEVMDKPIEIIQPSKPRGRPPKPKAEEEYKEPKPRGRPKKINTTEVLMLPEPPKPQKKLKIGVKKIKETESKIKSQEKKINKMLDSIKSNSQEIKETQTKTIQTSKTKKPKGETYERYYNGLQRLFKAPEFPQYTSEKIMENIENREKLTVNQIKSVFKAAEAYYKKFRDEVEGMRDDNEMALNDGDEDAIPEDDFENVIFDFESEYYAPSWDYFINYLGETETPKLKSKPKESKPKESKPKESKPKESKPTESKPKKLKIGVKKIKEIEAKIKSQENEIKSLKKIIKNETYEPDKPKPKNLSLEQKRKKLIDLENEKIRLYGPDEIYDSTIRFLKNMTDEELSGYNPGAEGYQLTKLSKSDVNQKRKTLIEIAEQKKEMGGDEDLYNSKIRLFKVMPDEEIRFYNNPHDLIPFRYSENFKESKPKRKVMSRLEMGEDMESLFKSMNPKTLKTIEDLKRKQNIKDTESKIKSQEERIRMMEDLVNSSKDFTPPKPRGIPKKTIQPSDFFLTPRIERNMPKKELSELTTLYNSTSDFKPSGIVKKNEMSKKDMKTMMDILDTPRVARAIPKKDMNELMSLLDAPKVSKIETKANMKSMIDLLDTPRVARMMPRKELNEMMSLLTTTKDFKPSEIIKKTKKSKKTKKEIKSMMSMLDTPRISRTTPSRDFQLFNDFLTPPRSTVNPVGRGVFTLDGLNQAFEGVDWTANRLKSSLKGYVMGRGDAYPPYVKTIIEKYGDQEIVGLTLSRNPLDSAIISFLNVLSLGKLNKRLERAGYDKMFHLRLNVKLQNGKTISIEKNPLINMEVSPKNLPKAEFKEVYNIPQGITLFNLLEAAQSKMGSKYFTYSTATNNCQNYVMNLLTASNIGDTEDITFLKQDVEQLFQKYGYLKNLTDKITDTAARANEIYYGAGFCC